LSIEDKKLLITAKNIVDDILARESIKTNYSSDILKSNANNKDTLDCIQSLLDDTFSQNNIAKDMIEYFTNIIGANCSSD
jgi:hypothetical protein